MDKNSITSIAVIIIMITLIGGLIFFSKNNKNNVSSNNEALNQLSNLESINKTPESSQAVSSNMNNKYTKAPVLNLDSKIDYKAVIHTTKGDIKIDLFEKKTPITVNNFVFLSKETFYNNTVFHRIIKDFMIQGGDPLGTGTGGPGYKFEDEPFEGEYVRGTMAMANAGPNTNGSQFFIMHKDTPLPKNYVIFGNVMDNDSLKVLDLIANSEVKSSFTGEKSTPIEKTTITSIEILEN